jgi:hypothetical protein
MKLSTRSHLKKIFSTDIGVEPSSQDLDMLEFGCGLRLGLVLISTENPNFEITSDITLMNFQKAVKLFTGNAGR